MREETINKNAGTQTNDKSGRKTKLGFAAGEILNQGRENQWDPAGPWGWAGEAQQEEKARGAGRGPIWEVPMDHSGQLCS